MDPVTAITTILALIPDLLMTSGGRLIAGGYIGGRYYSTTALMKSGYLYTGGYVYTAGRRKKNPWVRYLKLFRRYINKTYTFPDRRKVAKEIYNELKKSGQLEMLMKHHRLPPEIREKLDQLLAIKPKTGLELALSSKKTAMEFPEILSPMEFPLISPTPSTPLQPLPPLLPQPEAPQPPTSGPKITELSLKEEEEMRKVAHENLAEDAEKTIKSFPENTPDDTKIAILVRNIQDKQRELVSQGNLMATDASVVLDSLADAAIKEPENVRNVIIEAASILSGKDADFIRNIIRLKERTLQAVVSLEAPGRPALTLSENVPLEELPPTEEELEKKSLVEKGVGLRKARGLRRARGVRRRRY
jgi:hypothetical protein